MKTKQGGYKAMIRDRVPLTVDTALKWCKVKTKWVDHVYYHFVWFLAEKDARDAQVRALMGIAKGSRNFDFDQTIDWHNLDSEEKKYWTSISTWVHWFEKNTLDIVDLYETLKIKRGNDEEYIKAYICNAKFHNLSQDWQDKLYNYMIAHIKKYYV